MRPAACAPRPAAPTAYPATTPREGESALLSDIVHHLRCPLCAGAFAPGDGHVRCPDGHSFDIARQGYLNLLTGRAAHQAADSPAMLARRTAFLDAGHYDPLTSLLADRCADAVTALPDDTCVLDVGAGTGHHLARVLDACPGRVGVALDLSAAAARRAARAHPRIGAVVADAWRGLPLPDACVAAALVVFAPRNAAELRRVLHPEGRLVVATPTDRHLHEAVDALGMLRVDTRKEERLGTQLGSGFHLASRDLWEAPLALSRADLESVVLMGPSARHLSPADLQERVRVRTEPITVTASVTVSVFRLA